MGLGFFCAVPFLRDRLGGFAERSEIAMRIRGYCGICWASQIVAKGSGLGEVFFVYRSTEGNPLRSMRRSTQPVPELNSCEVYDPTRHFALPFLQH